MKDPDNPQPGESSAPDDEVAYQAMRAEWAGIREFVMGTDAEGEGDDEEDGEKDAVLVRRAERMRQFLANHKEVLDRRGGRPEMTDPEPLLEAERQFLERSAAIEEAESRLLESTADLADKETDLNLALLESLDTLERLPQADWDRMDTSRRITLVDTLAELRGRREDLLARLPIALRREWEEKLGE